jgi:aerobic carbon-monoxide dehydrogenase medium subunit
MHDLDFIEPASVAEASRAAADLGDNARFIAGGTALMLALRQRLLSPTTLVSLGRLEALRGISIDSQGALHLGAMSLHADVAASELVRKHVPVLADMASQVANPQVRNQGTLGGNLCYADPATDPACCLLALGARIVLVSHRGQRELPLTEFLVDYFTTAIEPDELVREIIVPPMAKGAFAAYARFLRTAAEHRPMASVATVVQLERGVCTQASIVVGAAVPVAGRVQKAELCLIGHAPSVERIHEAAATAALAITPLDDLRGSAAYRRQMVQVQVRRTLAKLFDIKVE